MSLKLLVCGTDTGIGKTVVSCALLSALRGQGMRSLGMKPVCAGIDAQGVWEDIEQIRAAGNVSAAPDDIAPYRLRAAASPHFAAAEECTDIRLEIVLSALARLEQLADAIVIEGVGGFRVPLSDVMDTTDMACAMGAPLLLVVPMRLGCINHALLTAEAIAARGLRLIGWVANAGIDADYTRVAETRATISDRIRAPCLGVLPKLAPAQYGGEHLAIDQILASLRAQQS